MAEEANAAVARPRVGADELRRWLKERIGKALGVSPDEVDVTHEFAELGLDSRQSVRLSGELEDWLKRTISPTVLMDFPTIERLVKHLSQ